MSKNHMSKTVRPTYVKPLTDAELRRVEGGFMAPGDEYCGTPYPVNPHPFVASIATIVTTPTVVAR